MSVITWVWPEDCTPPHGLDLTTAHDRDKVNMLAKAFLEDGFDKSKSALVGYPLDGKIQLLSGTHRHYAAGATNIQLPVTLWLRKDIEKHWGHLEKWWRIMEDIPVAELELWGRAELEASYEASLKEDEDADRAELHPMQASSS